MKWLRWVGMAFLAGTSACGGSDADEVRGPSPGEALCLKIDACPDIELVATRTECARRFDEDVFPFVPAECKSCVQLLTCGDWAVLFLDLATMPELCPECPQ